MDDVTIQPPTTWKDQAAPLQVLLAHNLLKIVLAFGAGFAVLLVLGGFVFALVAQFAGIAFLRLAFLWNPAFQVAGRLLGVRNMPARLARPPAFYLLFSIPFLLLQAAVIVGLVWLLLHIGFCGQNFICLLAQSVSR